MSIKSYTQYDAAMYKNEKIENDGHKEKLGKRNDLADTSTRYNK